MVPDYSPAMLRLFLAGRATRLAGAEGLTPRAARQKLTLRLRRDAGVARDDLAAAFAGTLRAATPRARLWAALGHFPSDHGVMLADDGGQAALSSSPLRGEVAEQGEAGEGVGTSPSPDRRPSARSRPLPGGERRGGRNGVGANEEDSAHG